MKIFLLRHGTAEDRAADGGDDSARALVAKGYEQCAAVAGFFRNMQLSFDRIVSSPYRRAMETAESVSQVLAESGLVNGSLEVDQRLTPHASVQEATDCVLQGEAETLLMVGHEPLLSHLAGELLGRPSWSLVLRKAGIVEMNVLSRHPLRVELRGLIRPGHLRGMHPGG